MKKVLITGSSGFVGSQILKILQNYDFEIYPIVRSDKSKIKNKIFTNNLFTEDDAFFINACKDMDLVIHSAWYAEPGKYLYSKKNIECLEGTIRLARISAELGVKRFVGIGTCFEYDLSEELLSTDTKILPKTPYASAKASVWTGLSNLLPLMGTSFLWCRLFFLTGENEDSRRLIPYIHKRLSSGLFAELTSGSQIVDYIDVKEAANQICEAAISNLSGAVNICSGEGKTVKEIAYEIADIYGRRDLLRFGSKPDRPTDPKKIIGVPYLKTK